MRPRFIIVGLALLTTCSVITNQVGHAQLGRTSGVVRPMASSKDSGPTEDNAPQSRIRLEDFLLAKNAGSDTSKLLSSTPSGRNPMDGTHTLLHQNPMDTANFATSAPTGLPTWSDSFTYQGLTYKYTMVGTDPKLGSKTTVIPTVIIPLRFVFPDGQVFDSSTDLIDGQTSVQGIINSPIFKNYNFVLDGKSVGNTQYADAFQRANFWDSVGGKARDYHVLLGQPTVLPTQTIVVPDGLGHYDFDYSTGLPLPTVDLAFLEGQTAPILNAANVSPSHLSIMVWGNVVAGNAWGYHGVNTANSNQVRTFIGTSYRSLATLNGSAPDTYPLSHEIIEWLDDPFTNNFTPGWNQAYISDDQQCDSHYSYDLLETADPVEGLSESVVPLYVGAFTYHVTEGMFIDFYTRTRRSRSVNGQYSMFNIGAQYGVPSDPSTPCTGHIELNDFQLYAINGSRFSEAYGVNNLGSVVGMYTDQTGARHGWVADATTFQTIDYPGAIETVASKINDAGTIVGFYFDAVGFVHGFKLQNGQFLSIDYPGAWDTAAYDVNLSGDIVGAYDGPDFNTHGFVLRSGVFSPIDFPFHHTTLANGINSDGKIVGYSSVQFGAPSGYPYLGFLLSGRKSSDVNFPGASETFPHDINNQSAITGNFANSNQYGDGFVTINSLPYEVYGQTFGLDDTNAIVGSYTYNGITYTMLGNLPSSH